MAKPNYAFEKRQKEIAKKKKKDEKRVQKLEAREASPKESQSTLENTDTAETNFGSIEK